MSKCHLAQVNIGVPKGPIELRAREPSAEAFTFGKLFPPPDEASDEFSGDISEPCPAL